MKQIISAIAAIALLHLSLSASRYLDSTNRIQIDREAREAKERQLVSEHFKRQEEQRRQKLNELNAQPTIVCPKVDYDKLGSQANTDAHKCELDAISQRFQRSLYQ